MNDSDASLANDGRSRHTGGFTLAVPGHVEHGLESLDSVGFGCSLQVGTGREVQ